MLIRLDEAGLKNVLGDIRTSCHAECVAVEWIAVALDQDCECVLGSGKNARGGFLIRMGMVGLRRGGSRSGCRHAPSVTEFSFSRQTKSATLRTGLRNPPAPPAKLLANA